MTNRTNRILPAAVAGALGMGAVGTAAFAAEPSTRELMDQIQQLQSKVQQMEATQQQQGATTEAQATDATVDSVLRDAERRSQLLQDNGGILAGYEKGKFIIRSADGNFLINPNLQLQLRHVSSLREDAVDVDDDGNIIDTDSDRVDSGFEVRRAKFAFDGHAYTPDLTYKLGWESSTNGGGVSLEDAWVRYAFADEWALRGGQFKDNWSHEESVSSKRQLAADRSLMNELLAGGLTDYVQGVAVIYDPGGQFRGEAAFHDGASSVNTNFTDDESDWGVSARGEYALIGDGISKAYDDFTALGNDDELLVLGAGTDFSQAGDADLWFHTVDAQWENTDGLAVYGALVGQYIDSPVADGYNWGFLAQAGYMLNQEWEVFGRLDWTSLDEDLVAVGLENDLLEFTVGVNYYLEGHAAKFTIDATYLPDGAPNDLTGIGVLATEETEFVVRGQFQLLL
jgi:hypothetical protein